MKVIKLNRTHKLYHKGFTHAFRGAYASDDDIPRICKYFESVYGSNRLDRNGLWYAGFGNSRMKVQTQWGGEYTTNPYWIAVRNEADLTAALLVIGGL